LGYVSAVVSGPTICGKEPNYLQIAMMTENTNNLPMDCLASEAAALLLGRTESSKPRTSGLFDFPARPQSLLGPATGLVHKEGSF
jgi:hypothetical protein